MSPLHMSTPTLRDIVAQADDDRQHRQRLMDAPPSPRRRRKLDVATRHEELMRRRVEACREELKRRLMLPRRQDGQVTMVAADDLAEYEERYFANDD